MLVHLIRKEVLDHIQSARFVILAVGGAIVIWLSLYSGYNYYQYALRDYNAAQSGAQERIEQIKNADLYNPGDPFLEITSISYLHNKPPATLSIFVRGLEPYLGRSNPRRTSTKRVKFSPTSTDPILGVFLPLDLGLVVQVVLSLFILLMCYDAVCGEKQSGTLSLLASYSLPRDMLLLGKLWGSLIAAGIAFGIPLLIGCLVILMMPDVRLSSVELERFGLILLAFTLYLSAATCLGLLASSITKRPATSFVILLTLWTGAVVLVPSLSMTVADDVRPAMSIQEYWARREAMTKDSNEQRGLLMREWRTKKIAELGQNWPQNPDARKEYEAFNLDSWRIIRERNEPVTSRLEEEYENRKEARQELALVLARVSPAFALKNATILLSGTGAPRQNRFETATNLFGNPEGDWFVQKKTEWGQKRYSPEFRGKRAYDVSDMPLLAYSETWPAEDVQEALPDLVVIVLWGLVCITGAYAGIVRYDLR